MDCKTLAREQSSYVFPTLYAEGQHLGQQHFLVGYRNSFQVVIGNSGGKAALQFNAFVLSALEQSLKILKFLQRLGNGVAQGDKQLKDGVHIELDDVVANAQMPYGKVVMVYAVNRHIEYFQIFFRAKETTLISNFKINSNEFQALGKFG